MSGSTEDRGSAQAALAAATLGFFVITLDAVVVNVALPTLGTELGAGVSGLQWVVDSYTMVFGALLLSAGSLVDRIGARRAFGIGLTLFALSSVACGLAPTVTVLVIARLAQGAGAAAMMPASMALIRLAYPAATARASAITLWAMGGAVAASSGPMIGGVLTLLSWRWIFLINVPAGLLTLAFLMRAPRSPRRPVPFDGFGQITAAIAMGALIYSAIEAGTQGPTSVVVVAAFVTAVVAAGLFALSQARGAQPMVPPALFAARNARIAVVVGFTFMVGYYGLPFLMSLYLQQERRLSAFATGLAFLPMMLTGLILTPFSARLVRRFGAKAMIVSGLLSMSLGLALIAALPETAPVPSIAALMMLVGLAGPLVAPPVTAVLLSSVPAALAGTASGVFNASRQLGGALAVGVFGTLLVQTATFMTGLRVSMAGAAAFALATAILSLRVQSSSPS